MPGLRLQQIYGTGDRRTATRRGATAERVAVVVTVTQEQPVEDQGLCVQAGRCVIEQSRGSEQLPAEQLQGAAPQTADRSRRRQVQVERQGGRQASSQQRIQL